MLIKPADDKTKDIEELQRLQAIADPATARRIDTEIRQIKAGIRGEAEAAYEMQVRWGHRTGWMILHDLRIEHDGLVAQIDHLTINRLLCIWVCESKHFAEGVAINEHGEFTAFFGGKPYGVASPIEQNARHIAILQRFLASGAVKLPTRLGITIRPSLHGLVLVSKGARVSRPQASVSGLETVVKVDQLFQQIEKVGDEGNPLLLAKVVSEQTVQDVARQIASHHKPASFNWAAKFGLVGRDTPRAAAASMSVVEPTLQPVVVPAAGLGATAVSALKPPAAPDQLIPSLDFQKGASTKPGKRYECHACRAAVELKVARFRWFNKPKFGGNVYCMDCQKTVRLGTPEQDWTRTSAVALPMSASAVS